ncbi:hypothetical protein HDU67_003783, partial [Dinochytrium kinnereticum]
PFKSEIGYVQNDVGVGCSNGVPGGDPRWNAILSEGTLPLPANLTVNANTVYPKASTVAVSQRMWGGANKALICFQKMKIRNRDRPELQVDAYIVDFCPTAGCLWPVDELDKNADIYGEETWVKLGGGLDDAMLNIEIQWPAGITPRDTGPAPAISAAAASPVTATSLGIPAAIPTIWLGVLLFSAMRLF